MGSTVPHGSDDAADLDAALDVVREYLRNRLPLEDVYSLLVWGESMALGASNGETFDYKAARSRARLLYKHRKYTYPDWPADLAPRAGAVATPQAEFARIVVSYAAPPRLTRSITAMELLALALLFGLESVPCEVQASRWVDRTRRKWEVIHTRAGAFVKAADSRISRLNPVQ